MGRTVGAKGELSQQLLRSEPAVRKMVIPRSVDTDGDVGCDTENEGEGEGDVECDTENEGQGEWDIEDVE